MPCLLQLVSLDQPSMSLLMEYYPISDIKTLKQPAGLRRDQNSNIGLPQYIYLNASLTAPPT